MAETTEQQVEKKPWVHKVICEKDPVGRWTVRILKKDPNSMMITIADLTRIFRSIRFEWNKVFAQYRRDGQIKRREEAEKAEVENIAKLLEVVKNSQEEKVNNNA